MRNARRTSLTSAGVKHKRPRFRYGGANSVHLQGRHSLNLALEATRIHFSAKVAWVEFTFSFTKVMMSSKLPSPGLRRLTG